MTNANRAWLYARLSRDDDAELNSLTNQQRIVREYAESNGFIIIGESSDDNISGMHFNREGIEQISEAVESCLIDAVIVKDLSRLGSHRTQTAMFIDFLRENDVRVISVTENIDTSNEEDDLMIGFKGIKRRLTTNGSTLIKSKGTTSLKSLIASYGTVRRLNGCL